MNFKTHKKKCKHVLSDFILEKKNRDYETTQRLCESALCGRKNSGDWKIQLVDFYWFIRK